MLKRVEKNYNIKPIKSEKMYSAEEKSSISKTT